MDNCSEFKRNRHYLDIPLSTEEEDYPLAYIILTHKEVVQVRGTGTKSPPLWQVIPLITDKCSGKCCVHDLTHVEDTLKHSSMSPDELEL